MLISRNGDHRSEVGPLQNSEMCQRKPTVPEDASLAKGLHSTVGLSGQLVGRDGGGEWTLVGQVCGVTLSQSFRVGPSGLSGEGRGRELGHWCPLWGGHVS